MVRRLRSFSRNACSLTGTGSFSPDASVALVVLAVAVSRVPWRIALRGIKAVSVILVITLLAHGLRWNPATVALVRLGPLAVDAEGLRTGIFFGIRIIVLVVGTSLLTLTTSPVALANGAAALSRRHLAGVTENLRPMQRASLACYVRGRCCVHRLQALRPGVPDVAASERHGRGRRHGGGRVHPVRLVR